MPETWWTGLSLTGLVDAQQGRLVAEGWPADEAREVAYRFWSKTDRSSECWIWTPKARRGQMGYGIFSVKFSARLAGEQQYAHRVAYQLVYGEIKPGMLIRHSCDNVRCVRPEHLLQGSHRDNTQDMLKRNRSRMQRDPEKARRVMAEVRKKYDSSNCSRRLTHEQRKEIARLRSEGWTLANLSEKFEVSKATIGRWAREYQGGDAE
jgi:hypothetical protein